MTDETGTDHESKWETVVKCLNNNVRQAQLFIYFMRGYMFRPSYSVIIRPSYITIQKMICTCWDPSMSTRIKYSFIPSVLRVKVEYVS